MPAQQPNPAFASVEDTPGLPRVLLIGDSISIGYTPGVRQHLQSFANLHRIPENAADTNKGVEKIEEWLGKGKWDLIHFNFGLHDLKVTPEGGHQVPLERYKSNLESLVRRLKQTGAKLIFATTTPVPEGKLSPPRRPGDAPIYNAAAAEVMQAAGVEINDLYAFALPKLDAIQRPANVHFTDEGSEALARRVAQVIRRAMEKPRATRSWPRHVIDDSLLGPSGVRFGDVNGDDKPDIVTVFRPAGIVRAYLNPTRVGARERWRAVTVGRVPGAADAVFADLDRNGRIDIVSFTQTGQAFEHWAPNDHDRYWDESAWVTKQARPETLQWRPKGGTETPIGREITGPEGKSFGRAEQYDLDHDGDLDLITTEDWENLGVIWFENPGLG
jgi:acyl-CoA thioesterase-1